MRVGASADLFSLDTERPEFASRRLNAWLDAWIFAGSPMPLRHVWRAGVQWVREGRHMQAEAVAADYRRALARILK